MVLLMFTSIAGNFLAGAIARRAGLSPGDRADVRGAISSPCSGPTTSRGATWDQFWWLTAMGVSQGVFALFTMYLPPLFPTLLRTTGAGFCYNIGRLVAAAGRCSSGFSRSGRSPPGIAVGGAIVSACSWCWPCFFPNRLTDHGLRQPSASVAAGRTTRRTSQS